MQDINSNDSVRRRDQPNAPHNQMQTQSVERIGGVGEDTTGRNNAITFGV